MILLYIIRSQHQHLHKTHAHATKKKHAFILNQKQPLCCVLTYFVAHAVQLQCRCNALRRNTHPYTYMSRNLFYLFAQTNEIARRERDNQNHTNADKIRFSLKCCFVVLFLFMSFLFYCICRCAIE